MPFANISLTDSFDVWRIKTNQLILGLDPIVSGNANLTGTITLSNPSFYNGNTTINVSNGVIKVKSNIFDANAVMAVSNTTHFTITGSGQLGTTIYFNIGTLSTTVNDVGVTTVPSALSVNTAHVHARASFDKANSVNTFTTTVSGVTSLSFNHANAAFSQANSVVPTLAVASAAFAKANAAFANTSGTFEGSLVVKGNFTPLSNVSHASANIVTQILNDIPTIIWDTSIGQIAEITLAANRIMGTPTGIKKGYYALIIKQDVTGSRTITSWPTAVFKWPGGIAPILSTGSGAIDIITFVSHDGVRLYGTYVNNLA